MYFLDIFFLLFVFCLFLSCVVLIIIYFPIKCFINLPGNTNFNLSGKYTSFRLKPRENTVQATFDLIPVLIDLIPRFYLIFN